MLLYEFLFLYIATILITLEALLILKSVIQSPIYEIKLFFLGMVITILSFVLYLIVPFYSNANQNVIPEIAIFDKIGYFFSMIGLLLLGYSFILPDFRSTYSNIFLLCILSGLGLSSAFINAVTSSVNTSGEFLKTTHDSIGLFLNYLFDLTIFYVIIKRISDVTKISKQLKKKHRSNNFWMILFVLFLVSFIVSIITNIVLPKQILPSNFYFFFVAIAFAFFIYFYIDDNAFFFLTPISLEAIIIAHKKSGITIYSESYKDNFRVEDMLSSVFSLLNISLQEVLGAKKELEEITFADKMVIIVPGEWVSSILIVSGKNLIIETLAKATTSKFEKQFKNELQKSKDNTIFDKNKFLNFKKVSKEIRQYIPL